jgi:hypothetical protein
MAVGDKINGSDYNGVQTTINTVLGTYYGQTVNSSQIASPTTTKITALQWQNLYKDILTCYDHQTASTGSLTWPTTSTKVYYADFDAYRTMANGCSTNYKLFNSVYYGTTSLTNGSQAGGWGVNAAAQETVQHVSTITWVNTTQAGYYFNMGGELRVTASLTGGTIATAGTKDYSWASMLTHMGTVRLGGDGTIHTTSSTTGQTVDVLRTDIGYNQLTTADILIFQMTSSSYNPNRVQIYARVSGASVIITEKYEDQSGQPNAPYGTDESITGVLNSYVTAYYASGGPSLNPPTYPIDLKITTTYVPSATDSTTLIAGPA